jgi:hypothetical protein
MKHKVWKLFQEKESNDWLDEDVFRLADECKMVVNPIPIMGRYYIKRLIRK